jgi:hypothetical protein
VKPSTRPDVLDDGARLHRPERHDLADRLLAVLLPDVLDDLAAPLEAEVHVHVGHGHALRVQEALEEQVELERADVRDAERVGDERAGRRAAPRADRDAAVARRLDEVGDDEEVARVAGLQDDAELVVEPLLDLLGQRAGRGAARAGIARVGPLGRELDEVVVLGGDALGEREARDVVLLPERHVHLVGDAQRVLEHVGTIGEALAHLGGALEVEPPVVVHPVGVLEILAEPDAQQDVVRRVVVGLEEVGVVGGDHRQPQLGRQAEDLLVELPLPTRVVRLDLEVVPVLEELGVPGGRLAGLLPAVLP